MGSAAPGMYAAFINLMADVTSKDAFTRNQAVKAHSRFVVGASMLFLAKAMASMMLDDEDDRTTEAKFEDALSRLNPKSKKFFTTEIPLGGGRRTIASEGGFFRTATQLSARIATDPKNAPEYVAKFMKGKKSPGLGTVLEIVTGEDYFGNEITTLESLSDALTPISLNEIARQHRGPVLDLVGDVTGLKGQSLTTLSKEKPHLTQTLEQMIFNATGFSAYTESSRGEFNRQMDREASRLHGAKDYRSLDYDQKVSVIESLEEKDVIKPKYKTTRSYTEFIVKKLDQNLDDSTLRKALVDVGIYSKFAAIPRYSVSGGGKLLIPIDSQDHKEMYRAFLKDMEGVVRSAEEELDGDALLDEAELRWENQLRANGY